MTDSQLTITTINKSESIAWNKYVEQHNNHTPYHLFSWLTAIESAYSHDVYCLAAKHDSKIVGILPLVNIRIPFKGSSICSLPFCDIGGCLADNEEIHNALELKCAELKKQFYAKSIEYRERIRIRGVREISDKTQFEGKKVSMLLPLPATSEELFSGFKSKLRSQIRKAEKNGLTCELGTSQQFVDEFYDVFSENMHRLGSPVHSKQWIEAICEQYKDKCIIAVVKSEGIPVGAGIVLYTNHKACIPWASTRAEYNRLSPNMMLYWALLEFVTEQGCTEFDFGRSTFNEGTYRFKQQWGALPVLLNWRDDEKQVDSQADNIQSMSSIKPVVENVWKKIPLSLANIIGPKVRKYISL